MRIQTILNRVEKFKSFTYGEAQSWNRTAGRPWWSRWSPRKNSRPIAPVV